MFSAYGQQPTPERIALYVETVGDFAAPVLLEALRDAMREAGEYPPGPGTVRRHALAVAKLRPGDPVELPAGDHFPRLGPGKAPLGALFDGLEGRVERNYRRVIERAREIVRERKLPASLDARLWSLGEAERELKFVESPCRCEPRRCGPEFWVSLANQRRLAGIRCGALPAEAARG